MLENFQIKLVGSWLDQIGPVVSAKRFFGERQKKANARGSRKWETGLNETESG